MMNELFVGCSLILFAVAVLCYVYDRLTEVENPFTRVKRPKEVSVITLNGLDVPTPVLYLPPTATASRAKLQDGSAVHDDGEERVFVFIPGNPGIAEFYIETMEAIQKTSGGCAHVYCVGHAGQGFVMDQQSLETAVSTRSPVASLRALEPELVSRGQAPVGSYMSYPHTLSQPFSLRDQIAHKLSALTQLRRIHPRARFVLSGHSMGSHCIMEMMRTVERVAVAITGGLSALEKWDCAVRAACPDVAAAEDPALMPARGSTQRPTYCKAVQALPEDVTRVEFELSELLQWTDLVTLPGPNPSAVAAVTAPGAPLLPANVPASPAADPLSWLTQAQLFFPTILRIGESPNGDTFVPLFARPWLVNFVIRTLSALPGFVTRTFVAFSLDPRKFPVPHAAARLMPSFAVLKAITHMAAQEMLEIRALDAALLRRQGPRILVYHAAEGRDGWAPHWQMLFLSAFARAEAAAGRGGARIIQDSHGLEHAFVNGGAAIVGATCVREALLCEKVTTSVTGTEHSD